MLNVTLRDLLAELERLHTHRNPAVGTTLNVNYHEIEFLEMLDRGAFGEVHRANWKGNNVAVKVILGSVCTRHLFNFAAAFPLCPEAICLWSVDP